MRTAILDENNVLVGAKTIKRPGKTHIDIGDLPADGSYFYRPGDTPEDGQFIPVGFGNGKPTTPTVTRDRAVFLMMRALLDDTPLPKECSDWCDWFENHGGVR